jgi:hypothetical protein
MGAVALNSIATTLALLGFLTSRAPAAEAPDDEPWLYPYAGPSRFSISLSLMPVSVIHRHLTPAGQAGAETRTTV